MKRCNLGAAWARAWPRVGCQLSDQVWRRVNDLLRQPAERVVTRAVRMQLTKQWLDRPPRKQKP